LQNDEKKKKKKKKEKRRCEQVGRQVWPKSFLMGKDTGET
jgi:hypothetical protein